MITTRTALAALGAAVVVAGVVLWAPWASPPELAYETVAGYPMKVYYHNTGAPVKVEAFGGMPALSVGEPLSADRIAAYAAEARKRVQPAPDLIRTGDRARFVLDDPDRLAWQQGTEENPNYFYIFAVLESPRASIISSRWVHELCIVAKTGEPFKPCPSHNGISPG
jgi:hypothetical protein